MTAEAPQVFKENRLGAVTFAGIGVILLILGPGVIGSQWMLFGAIFLGIALYWLLPMRMEFQADRIVYRTAFRFVEMRLDELERFYYELTLVKWFGLPGGRRYKFRLIDERGRKIALGARMRWPKELGQKLIECTTEPLTRKCAQRYAMGQEVNFDSIRVSQTTGVTVKRPRRFGFGYHMERIPLDQVSEYAIRNGHFYIWRKGETYTRGPLFHNVANGFVLKALLDTIYGDSTPAQAAKAP